MWAFARGNGIQNISGGAEANLGIHFEGAIALVIGRMQHKAARGFHWAAAMNMNFLAPRFGLNAQLAKNFWQFHVFERLVDDETHGAFGRMRANVDHAALEARIGHCGHGSQELADHISRAD